MPISPYVAWLRSKVGSERLLLASVSVLPRDASGRILLVRHADSGVWGIIGGTIELDETPEGAAVRETKEEAGVDVELSLVTVLGGPEFSVTYTNGDVGQFVVATYEATIVDGTPTPDNDEVTEVGWFSPADLTTLDLNPFAQALLTATGYR